MVQPLLHRMQVVYSLSILVALLFFSCSLPEPDNGIIVNSAGEQLYYQVLGNSPDTLLVIHGGPGAGIESVLPAVKPLSQYFTLILYDQRGGGRSTLPDTSRLGSEFHTLDLETVRSHFGLSKMNVLAHSFGAILVAEYLTKYPSNIDKLILHAATGPTRKEAAKYYMAEAKPSTPAPDPDLILKTAELLNSLLSGDAENPMQACKEYETLSRKIAQHRGKSVNYQGTTCSGSDASVAYYYQYTAQLSPLSYGNWDYTHQLESLDVSTLVLYGAKDTSGQFMQQQWVDAFKKSRLITVPNSEKGTLSDNPEYAIPEIVRFLKQ